MCLACLLQSELQQMLLPAIIIFVQKIKTRTLQYVIIAYICNRKTKTKQL